MLRDTATIAVTVAALLALGACSSSGGDAGGDTDASAFAGLWDASEYGTGDERYVAISADGRYTEYDYRQDSAASDGNCHVVTELVLRSLGSRPAPPVSARTDGSLTDDSIWVEGDVPTFDLSDGRTLSLLVLKDPSVIGVNENGPPDGPILLVWTSSDSNVQQSEWSSAPGIRPEDLERCDGITGT